MTYRQVKVYYTEIAELDETILFALIDRIEMGETRRQGQELHPSR